MPVFSQDEQAWSALTKAIEGAAGNPGSPLIVQAPTILRPLSIRGVNQKLAQFRKHLVGDNIPAYQDKNSTNYIATGKRVEDGYRQYVLELNNEIRHRLGSATDKDAIKAALQAYEAAQKAFTIFKRDAGVDWKNAKKANPSLTRGEWDDNYGDLGYTPKLRILEQDSFDAYGFYKSKLTPYPILARIAENLARIDSRVSREALPQTEDELQTPESWEEFLKTNIDVDWTDFFGHEAPSFIEVTQSSSSSTHYDHRWSAGGSFSYGFFSIGGSASGGTIEDHLRAGTQSVRLNFKKLSKHAILRGRWYDEGIIGPYVSMVDANTYWGRSGTLNLIPIEVILGRGLTIEVSTSQTAYDSFQNWHQNSGSTGFRFGPWAVGAGGNSSTSSNSVTNTSSGSTISFQDNSDQVYVIAVVSNKMDDYILAPQMELIRSLVQSDFEKFELEDREFMEQHGPLFL